MKKPAQIRDHLLKRTPWLNNDHTRLVIFVENGYLVAKGDGSEPSGSLSYEQQYKLTMIVLDFPGDPEEIIVPIYEWLATHQPDLLQNPDWQKTGFTFLAEIIDLELYDLSVTLELSERIIAHLKDKNATVSAERYDIKTADEPQYDELLKAIL